MRALFEYLHALFYSIGRTILGFLRLAFKGKEEIFAENIMLRSQIALLLGEIHDGKREKLASTRSFRMIWVLNSQFLKDKHRLNVVYAKATYARWHNVAFKLFWRAKSRPKGRPPLTAEVQSLIYEIHIKNPTWSPGRIRDQLTILNIVDVPSENTIKKYIKGPPPRLNTPRFPSLENKLTDFYFQRLSKLIT